MLKTKYIFLKTKKIKRIKKNTIPTIILLFTASLVIFSKTNIESAKYGIKLWANYVVPSLLPFFIATELLGYTNIFYYLGKLLNRIINPIFNVPGEGAFPLIMGIISGYPVGAKIVSNLKIQGKITNIEAERLISFTNNSGPLFIIGTVGIGLFKNAKLGNILFISHVLACISVGIIFRWWKYKDEKKYIKEYLQNNNKKEVSIANLGEILSYSITSAINTILLIGGFIVLFCVIISILENSGILGFLSNLLSPLLSTFHIPNSFSQGIISGILELTNGVSKVSMINSSSIITNILICSFLLGFGGLSITLQILSIISKANISIKPYIIGKLLQGILAAVYTYFIICFLQPQLIL